MGASYRYVPIIVKHDVAHHLGTVYAGDSPSLRLYKLGVVWLYGGGIYHYVTAFGYVLGAV